MHADPHNVSTAQDVHQLLTLLHSSEPITQQHAVKSLSVLVREVPNAVQLIDAKVAAPALCHQLSAYTQDTQLAAASTITALAKEGPNNQFTIASAGALPLLMQQMSAKDIHVQSGALSALGHLAADCQPVASWMGSNGTTNQIQLLLRSPEVEVQLAAIDAIDSIARSDVRVRAMIGNQQTLTVLVQLLQAPDTDIQHAAASALANIALVTRDDVNVTMMRCGAAAALVQKLDPKHEAICHQATRALCNLSGDNDDCDETISRTSAVEALARVFQCKHSRITSAAGKALGNLALYSVPNQETIANSGVVEECLRLISHYAPPHVLEAACRLLHVLLTDSPQVHMQVLDADGTDDLINLLNSSNAGVRQSAAGALSHLVYPKSMPGWRENNDLMNSRNAMHKFQHELAGLRAKHQNAHSGDMVTDQLNEIGLDGNNSGGASVAATESQGTGSDDEKDNESLTGMEDDFQEMHV